MSKAVKEMLTTDLGRRLDGVEEALLVNVVGLNGNAATTLRKELRQKNIHLMVIKNSLARRATEGTPLAGIVGGLEGNLAVMWGGTDIVALAKEAMRLHKSTELAAFEAKGGILDGDPLSATRVEEISKWPSRQEQLSILVGQILGPGRTLAAQLIGPGAMLASQIKKKGEGDGEAVAEPEGSAPEASAAESPAPEAAT